MFVALCIISARVAGLKREGSFIQQKTAIRTLKPESGACFTSRYRFIGIGFQRILLRKSIKSPICTSSGRIIAQKQWFRQPEPVASEAGYLRDRTVLAAGQKIPMLR
jgi:hypothetical protein